MLGCPSAQASEQKCPPALIDRDSSKLCLQGEQSHKSNAAVITTLPETTHPVYDLQGTISLVANRTLNIDQSILILSSRLHS
ncbi:hypothetical protein MITS9504_02993 [Synechococcus sp. MIT S9504]|nr:hypothetical protein MITS9504_02993 [Synechococcus sp. MIT S9504]